MQCYVVLMTAVNRAIQLWPKLVVLCCLRFRAKTMTSLKFLCYSLYVDQVQSERLSGTNNWKLKVW